MVKFAVLGTGHIGSRHIDIIKEKATLVAATTNLDYLLSTDCDVVSICTPNADHSKSAIKSLNAGKHVIIEKPMCLSNEEAQAIAQASIKANKRVFCVMQNRYSAPNVWLKENLHQLGDIYMVQMNCYWNRNKEYYDQSKWRGTDILDGGTLYTQFSHFIDILYYLFGDISNVQARFRNFNHDIDFEDTGIVLMFLIPTFCFFGFLTTLLVTLRTILFLPKSISITFTFLISLILAPVLI